jgi:hypothetical protein
VQQLLEEKWSVVSNGFFTEAPPEAVLAVIRITGRQLPVDLAATHPDETGGSDQPSSLSTPDAQNTASERDEQCLQHSGVRLGQVPGGIFIHESNIG